MLIFGIDQGLAHLGYSVMEVYTDKKKRKGFVNVNNKFYVKIIEKGCLITNNDNDFPKRLFRLMTIIENKILENDPDVVCCEALFFSPPAKGSRNKSSAIMTTNMVTGTIAYICGKHKIKFSTYPPTKVKKNLCNNGRAQKDEVIKKIKELFEIDVPKSQLDHICDSIAIGLAYLFTEFDNDISDNADDNINITEKNTDSSKNDTESTGFDNNSLKK